MKDPTVPREWEHGSYEGTHFRYNQDGTWTAIWHDPKLDRPSRPLVEEINAPGEERSSSADGKVVLREEIK